MPTEWFRLHKILENANSSIVTTDQQLPGGDGGGGIGERDCDGAGGTFGGVIDVFISLIAVMVSQVSNVPNSTLKSAAYCIQLYLNKAVKESSPYTTWSFLCLL